MPMNLNEAQDYREVGAMVPDGTFCWISGKVSPGGASLPGYDPMDAGLFKQSGSSDVIFAAWEFTVIHGPHTGAKIFTNMSMAGGELDDRGNSKAGNISRSFYKGMVESAFGIPSGDQSPQAVAYRNIPGVKALEGVKFAIKTGIELGGDNQKGGVYPDKTIIAKIVLPGDPEYAPMRAGQEVPPQPTGPRSARGARSAASGHVSPGPGQQQALWQTDASAHAAAAAPAPAPVAPQPAAGPAQAWTGAAAPAPAAAWPGGNGAAPVPAAAPAPAAPPPAAPASGPAWLNG